MSMKKSPARHVATATARSRRLSGARSLVLVVLACLVALIGGPVTATATAYATTRTPVRHAARHHLRHHLRHAHRRTHPRPRPTAPAPVSVTGYFAVSSANIRCDPADSEAETRADTALIRDQEGGLLGQQENCPTIQPWVYSTLGPTWSHYTPAASWAQQVPISWKTASWRLVAEGYRDINPGGSRPIPLSWVVLTDVHTGMRVVRMNTHFISGAWKANIVARQPEWLRNQSLTEDQMTTLQNQYPDAVVVLTGDFNQGTPASDFPNTQDVIGTQVDGHAVTYDERVPDDTEMVMHLANPRISVASSKFISCQVWCGTQTGPLYTDHVAVQTVYEINPAR